MTTYTINVPDEQERCITAAREAYNAYIPAEVWDEDSQSMVPNPALKATNAEYMEWVMQNAAASYCVQYPDPEA